MPDPRKVTLEESGDRLLVGGDLDWRSQERFQAACHRLLEGGARQLTVDLVGVAGISSANMSFLVSLHYWAQERGKRLVLRVGPEVAKVFDRTRLEDLVGMNIEKAGPDGEG